MLTPAPVDASHRLARACRWGLGTAVTLVVLAVALPPLLGWNVHVSTVLTRTVPPLYARWAPHVGVGTPVALVLAVLGVLHGPRLAQTLPWRRLLVTTYAVGLGWALSLALVSGPSGLSRATSSAGEYLVSARQVHSLHALLTGYVARIPADSLDAWPTHPSGHPPGALLLFVLLVRLGLGSALATGLVLTVLGASAPVAVLVTVRRLGAEPSARLAAPFLVLTPAALWVAVTADAAFAAIGAWGVAALAVAATTHRSGVRALAVVSGGLLLGVVPTLSYGLGLFATLPLAVLLVTRRWRLLAVATVVALVPATLLALGGFSWWDAAPALHDRYWGGIAKSRPAAYWLWADLAALVLSAGPALGAGLGALVARGRQTPGAVRWLVGAAAASVAAADLSLMSKAEVERIWLPFVPWLLLATAALPARWRRPALAGQVVLALVLEHLLDTTW